MENKNDIFNKTPKGGKPKMFRFNLYWMYGLIFIMLVALYMTNDSSGAKELGWTEFQKLAQENVFDKMTVYNKKNLVEATVKNGKTEQVFGNMDVSKIGVSPKVYVKIPSADKFSDFYDKAVADSHIDTQVRFEEGDDAIWNFLVSFGPIILLIGVWMFLMRRMSGGTGAGPGGVFSVGKAKAQLFDKDNDRKVTFKDVAGLAEAKQEVEEIVSFLKNPEKYTELGGKIPKGALLVGPPGTGKTLLAKAVAGEANVPFFSLSGSDFVEMFVGVGASRVRDLFRQAKEKSPCIVFIDEIDAIGKSRDNSYNSNDEREQTLNQLLAEMDGFDSSKGILILAATNRPEVLDPALLRPGRFDRRIIVERPDLKGRVEILKVHAKNVSLDETVDLDGIALATSGAVGSDLANMINEAAILAVKNGRKAVSQKDLLEAVEVVLVGKEKKDRILSQEERKIVSYHEVGHALVTALQKDSEPVQKITIVPRTMGALGYVMQVPEEEKYLNTKSELEAMIVECLGGRAAEEIVFGNVTTGASNDIEKATKIVRAMITQYGMSEKFGLIGLATQQNQYLDGRMVLNCGDATATEIDHEVMKILKESYEQAKELLAANRDAMDEIAAYLIQKETITGKEFMEIFHQVIAKRNGNAEEAVENPENTETENTALPEADFTVNPEV